MHGLAFHRADDFLENTLNSRKPGLHLPAMKLRAVVSERDANARAGLKYPADSNGPRARFCHGLAACRHIGHCSGS